MSTPDGRAEQAQPSAKQPVPSPPAHAPHILVVDDDVLNQRVMSNLLKRKGWTSAAAHSGNECLEKVAAENFDLVLLDLQMPEMDGFTTAQRLRQQETERSAARTPIVALTALRLPDTRERCLACGMDDHLTKPVNTRELYTSIQRILRLPET
jgi:CheY-like chemotaxis protein